MYNNAKLEIYSSLTLNNGDEPDLVLTITSDEIIDWFVSPLQGAADNMFEIYGRTCRISLLRRGAFDAFISQKVINYNYPEYYDASFRLINEKTGEPIFTGALPLQNINHRYDSALMDITLVDALSVLVVQSRKIGHNFDDSILGKQWYFDNGGHNDIHKILHECMKDLAIGIGQYTITDSEPLMISAFPLHIDGLPFDIESYRTRAREVMVDVVGGEPPNIDKEVLQPLVKYFPATGQFDFMMIYAWRYKKVFGMDVPYHYRFFYYRALFNKGNLLLPTGIAYAESSETENYQLFAAGMRSTTQRYDAVVSGAIHDDFWIRFSHAPMNAGITIDNYIYAMGAESIASGYQLLVKTPIKFDSFVFQPSSITYEAILFVILSGNALHVRADEMGRLHITGSIIKAGRDIEPGYPIGDEYIIDQVRIGTFASAETLGNAFSTVENGINMGRALIRVFSSILNSLTCKLSFALPDSFFLDNNIKLFKTVNIDGHDYILTSISYPENGLIQIECVGAWN